MSPFLPPHRQYDFGPDQSPILQYNEEVEDSACCSSLQVPQSPLPYFHNVDPGPDSMEEFNDEKQAGQDAAYQDLQKADQEQDQPQSRSHTLRKRNTVEVARVIIKRQSKKDTLPSILTSKNPINTITLDRFSACIPCRRRKIKCIPRGDSHHYLSNGTNNGVCATCIRRKKDCFWPKIDLATVTRASPSTPCQQEVTQIKNSDDVEEMQCCEEKKEEDLKNETKCKEVQDKIDEITNSIIVKQEEVDLSISREPLMPLTFDETHFGIPGQGFGRSISSPGLSSSSSSSSSSPSPVSPRTDASFLSPTLTESFFFDDKPIYTSPSVTYLDNLHQALQSEALFAGKYYCT